MATEPSITISQPNGSADFSSTENRYWLRSRPTPGEQGSAGCLGSRGKEGRDVRLGVITELSRESRALANALPIVCALQAPVTDLSLPPPPRGSLRSPHCCARASGRRRPRMLQQPRRGLYPERRPPPAEKAGSAPGWIPPLRTAPRVLFTPTPTSGVVRSHMSRLRPRSYFHAKWKSAAAGYLLKGR